MRTRFARLFSVSSHLISKSSRQNACRPSLPMNQALVLQSPQIKEFRTQLENILSENEKYFLIYDQIVKKFDQLNKPKAADKKNLCRKLKFRLSYIINLIRKLTNTCNKAYLNDSSKLRLLTDTIVGRLDNVDHDDETELEIELLGFDNFDFEDFDVDSSLGEQLFGKLKVKVDELRLDFEFIDEHINQLRVVIAKEWMHNYEDKCLQSMYGSTSDNPNDFGQFEVVISLPFIPALRTFSIIGSFKFKENTCSGDLINHTLHSFLISAVVKSAKVCQKIIHVTVNFLNTNLLKPVYNLLEYF
ncbi:hypothetical protein BpHYR1_021454 [Brachionus plicatilis]|uniref:Uncharacterized protein n=1 Tax=Brachionus plicatilis TaxID=10195 RepID=A0A3M7PPY4_BRAPC|nr:hypothetical protein BpHYR1_021454 [Brachionus plicatilis]